MRRKTIWLCVMIGILFVSLATLFAQDTTSDTIYGLVTVDTADIRVGPDFAYAVIGELPRDASVTILGRAGDFFERWDGRQWVKIDYGNNAAWVYARLLRTSIAFNSIPPTGRLLPRDANGRVPDGFDLNSDVCSQWHGTFTLSGDFMSGGNKLTVTYPTLQGANVYSVIVIAPNGDRRAFDSTDGTSIIDIGFLPQEGGTYTWRVAPYWTDSDYRYNWQQVCLLQTGGTFQKPDTTPPTSTPYPR